ncbi:hypothetical protein [Streptomyces sp. YPW6]|uniref:hypothetical protein n=1 Tax=Streptomyces sp. YPW6 TaxID=2840373 RepID=UPI00209A7525|nr:hypothetical protein [Streptomyces sp. YPW6]
MASGSTVIDVPAEATKALRLGDEQRNHLLAYSDSGRRSVVKQTAVRGGVLLVIVSDSPALVDADAANAVGKGHRAG